MLGGETWLLGCWISVKMFAGFSGWSRWGQSRRGPIAPTCKSRNWIFLASLIHGEWCEIETERMSTYQFKVRVWWIRTPMGPHYAWKKAWRSQSCRHEYVWWVWNNSKREYLISLVFSGVSRYHKLMAHERSQVIIEIFCVRFLRQNLVLNLRSSSSILLCARDYKHTPTPISQWIRVFVIFVCLRQGLVYS